LAAAARIGPPATLVVGPVVALGSAAAHASQVEALSARPRARP
jgi:hypothetical protein